MADAAFRMPSLLYYSLVFMLGALLLTAITLMVLGGWHSALEISLYKVGFQLILALFYGFSLAFLLLRFAYYFLQMLLVGRAQGVGVLCLRNVFNPFNFLFLPMLLNPTGKQARSLCWKAVLLMLMLYVAIYLFVVLPR